MISLSTKLRHYNVYYTSGIPVSHVTNYEVRRRTGQPLLSHTVRTRRLKLFGHVAQAEKSQDNPVLYKPAYCPLQETGGGVQVVQDTPG